MQAQDVQARLAEALPDCDVEVQNDGNHFLVVALSDRFEGMSKVRKQQTIYGPLNDLLADGTIHALTIKAFTPQEWREQQAGG